MLSPDTAVVGESIWDVTPRSEFEKNIAELTRLNDQPATSQVYKLRSEDSHPDFAFLPLDIERELADDFAFIAACEEGVNTVTATALELMNDSTRLVVAANEGIRMEVKETMTKVLSKLEACARLGEMLVVLWNFVLIEC